MTAVLVRETRLIEVAPARTSPTAGRPWDAHVTQDIVEEWGVQSFPASDPPANW
jgi:hypothetical protein